LNEKVAAPVKKTELTAGGSIALTTQHPLSAKVGTDFADKWRSLGRYSLLATKGHGVYFFSFFGVWLYKNEIFGQRQTTEEHEVAISW
jgi:hypothetical protein